MQKREGMRSTVLLPVGFKFQPTDEELISGHLSPKCREENLPFEFIPFSEAVYEEHPSDFCTNSTAFFGDDNIAKHYFFTDLNRANERAVRKVGPHGHWHESQRKKIKNNKNEIIGYRKLLNFIRNGEGKKATEWSMHEFSLCLNEGESKNLVLCVIQNKKKEKGTGSCLVLGLDSGSGSGSGRSEIAWVKSCSVDSGSPMSCSDNLDLLDKETAEAKRGTGGLDHTVPQSDEEMAEAERGTGGLDHTVPQSDEEMAEAERGTGGFEKEIPGVPDRVLAVDTVPQTDEAERGAGGLFDEETAEAERGTGGLEEDIAGELDRVNSIDSVDWRLLSQFLSDFTTANENPCPAQDEETQQSKKMRYNPQLDNALCSFTHIPLVSPIE